MLSVRIPFSVARWMTNKRSGRFFSRKKVEKKLVDIYCIADARQESPIPSFPCACQKFSSKQWDYRQSAHKSSYLGVHWRQQDIIDPHKITLNQPIHVVHLWWNLLACWRAFQAILRSSLFSLSLEEKHNFSSAVDPTLSLHIEKNEVPCLFFLIKILGETLRSNKHSRLCQILSPIKDFGKKKGYIWQ